MYPTPPNLMSYIGHRDLTLIYFFHNFIRCRLMMQVYIYSAGLLSFKSESEPLCRLCRLCRLNFSQNYTNSPYSITLRKKYRCCQKAYRVYRAYREAWIGISRQISLQNLCRLRGKVYMNPTWRRRWQNRQSFGFLRFAFVYIWKKKNFQIKPKIIPKTSLAGLQSCMIIMQNPVNLLFQHRPEEIRGKADENQADSSKLLK